MTPYYEEDGIVIYHGDCRDVLPTLGPVDLILTDPPYGTQDLGGGYGRRRLHSKDGKLGRTIANDKDLKIIAGSAKYFKAILNNGGYIATFCSSRRMLEHALIFSDLGFSYIGEIIWYKGSPGLGYTIRYSHESCLIYRNGDREKPISAAMSVVCHPPNKKSKHPHEKPVKFWVNIMNLRAGDILDPFMGSGTTLRAAKDLGRKCIGIELEEKYCEIAVNRLRQQVLDL